MSDQADKLIRIAEQLIETDMLLGGEFIPAGGTPAPEIVPEAEPASPPRATLPEYTPTQKAEMLKALNDEVSNCTECQLADSRTNTVFGEGDPNANLMFVGEAPGADEDASGRPFIGRAGELLTKMIEAMGLTREDVCI